MSYIIAMPEKNVALVQMPLVPNKRGHMCINVKQLDQHYSFIDLDNFTWNCTTNMWRPRRPTSVVSVAFFSSSVAAVFFSNN